ncbi:unnamed protein product [Cylicocyclus nassatus]|uniref:Cytochrome P450 n=1 Tax=Cylicocyclus nassatus TaxID=53992 RepID=A0AA36LZY6_CYLNA|nr:unnamed protein product [Cylicocyclus nassatus]
MNVTYGTISELKFLDQCTTEMLRIYPPVVRTNCLCTKDITLKGIRMKKGCIFTLPIRAIHYCADYYSSPMEFDPERWTTENRSLRNPLTFVPFGYGPRNCVGMRVAQMQMKVAMVHIPREYELRPGEDLKLPIRINTIGSMRTAEELSIVFKRV